ncbi:MAG: signal peptidase I [Chloroflexota bacterium]
MTDQPVPPPSDAQAQPEPQAQPRGRSKFLDSAIEIATTVALAVILYVVIQTFIVQTYRVEQQSMLTTLQPDQHLLIDKLTPRFDDYSRGDIIVFHPPADFESDGTPFIKRVIGVAGDHIEIHDNAVWVNGAKLDEPYVDPRFPIEAKEWDSIDVPPGDLIVMGDHRNASVDSRDFGPVPVENVIGRAVLRFWPLDTLGIIQTPTYPNVPLHPEGSPAASAAP